MNELRHPRYSEGRPPVTSEFDTGPRPQLTRHEVQGLVRGMIEAALQCAHPVGSVVVNVSGVNPGVSVALGGLGYGTWIAFGAGRVMVGLAAGDPDFGLIEKVVGSKDAAPTGASAAGGSHGHGLGTLAVDAGGAHTHSLSGAIAAESAHTHSVTSNVSVNAHATHTHSGSSAVTVDDHPVTEDGGSAGGTQYLGSDARVHTVTNDPLTIDAGGPTTHTVNNPAVTSGAGSSHTHGNGTLAVASDGSHSHTLSGALASAADHTHGPGTLSTSVIQPSIVVCLWKRTA